MQIVFISPVPKDKINIIEPYYSGGGGNEGIELVTNRVRERHIIGTQSYQYYFLDGKERNELIIEADKVFLTEHNELRVIFSLEKQIDIDRLRMYVAKHPAYKEEIRHSAYFEALQKKAKKIKPEPKEADEYGGYSDWDRKYSDMLRNR